MRPWFQYGISLLSLVIIDLIWLNVLASQFYLTQLGPLLRYSDGVFKPLWIPALVVYLVLAAGIVFYVLPKATSNLSALGWGAGFGLLIYAVYDFTNYATLANWPFNVCIVDVIWGMVLCGVVSMIAYYLTRA